jgi:hypothetical protein
MHSGHTYTATIPGLHMACTAMTGEMPGANMSGENAKDAANADGADMNGESMSTGNGTVGNGTVGVIGITGDSNSAKRRSDNHCM